MTQVEVEHVLVVPTALFHELGHFQGFRPQAESYLDRLLAPEHLSYRPRDEVEDDPSFKQLIPYVVFRHLDSAGRDTVFAYRRGKGQGEQRLHSKRSVGIGGHISSADALGPTPHLAYDEGLRRELAEEVRIETPYTERRVGLINDDETEVGRVHLGVVHLVDVEQAAVFPREADIVDGRFVRVDDLLNDLSEFETWSQITLRALFG